MLKYERKLLKFWAQSFLLGVPKIIVGFRDQDGICHSLEELDTASIPGKVLSVGRRSWDGNVCINFTGAFLECKSRSSLVTFGYLALTFSRAQADNKPRRDMENSQKGQIPGD